MPWDISPSWWHFSSWPCFVRSWMWDEHRLFFTKHYSTVRLVIHGRIFYCSQISLPKQGFFWIIWGNYTMHITQPSQQCTAIRKPQTERYEDTSVDIFARLPYKKTALTDKPLTALYWPQNHWIPLKECNDRSVGYPLQKEHSISWHICV